MIICWHLHIDWLTSLADISLCFKFFDIMQKTILWVMYNDSVSSDVYCFSALMSLIDSLLLNCIRPPLHTDLIHMFKIIAKNCVYVHILCSYEYQPIYEHQKFSLLNIGIGHQNWVMVGQHFKFLQYRYNSTRFAFSLSSQTAIWHTHCCSAHAGPTFSGNEFI